MNSTIKRKTCKCGCSKMPSMSYNGYFYDHAPQELKDKIELKSKSKKEKKLAKQREQNKVRHLENSQDNIAANKQIELNEWFKYNCANSPKKCENCGKDLSNLNDKYWRGSQDHIIEKSEINGCPSVASELDNHCVLGFFCCHSQKHTSHLNLSKMPIFPLLKERFKKFEHLINEEEKRKIPKIFLN